MQALQVALIGIIAALAGVATAALRRWQKKLEDEQGRAQAEVAVRTVEQVHPEMPGPQKKRVALSLAPLAKPAHVEAAVFDMKGGI